MTHKPLALLCMVAGLLAGCSAGSGASGGVAGSARPTPTTGNGPASNIPPKILREQGLESVIGQSASFLAQRFGKARIDLAEGDARKLQFVSSSCVLDIFLYPLERGAAPVATHIEARQRVGGADAERAQCIESVERSVRGG